ncbi:MAG: hypothetical protein QXU64_05195 [Thermofilaceae archaeon]
MRVIAALLIAVALAVVGLAIGKAVGAAVYDAVVGAGAASGLCEASWLGERLDELGLRRWLEDLMGACFFLIFLALGMAMTIELATSRKP